MRNASPITPARRRAVHRRREAAVDVVRGVERSAEADEAPAAQRVAADQEDADARSFAARAGRERVQDFAERARAVDRADRWQRGRGRWLAAAIAIRQSRPTFGVEPRRSPRTGEPASASIEARRSCVEELWRGRLGSLNRVKRMRGARQRPAKTTPMRETALPADRRTMEAASRELSAIRHSHMGATRLRRG